MRSPHLSGRVSALHTGSLLCDSLVTLRQFYFFLIKLFITFQNKISWARITIVPTEMFVVVTSVQHHPQRAWKAVFKTLKIRDIFHSSECQCCSHATITEGLFLTQRDGGLGEFTAARM